MAIKIAIANQKGGVGKTTVAVNTADVLIHSGYSVLFLDLDPQHNSTSVYGAQIDGTSTLVDVLKQDVKAKDAIQTTALGDIIAGDALLAQEENYFNSQKAREHILSRVMKDVEDDYDFIIMDTPPNLGIYMINALTYANGCVIPIKAEQFSIDGLGLLLETINEVLEYLNHDLKIYGVLLNIYDARTSMDREIKNILPAVGKDQGFNTFDTAIRISQDIKKAQSKKESTKTITKEDGTEDNIVISKSLFDNFPDGNAVVDYISYIKELLEVSGYGK